MSIILLLMGQFQECVRNSEAKKTEILSILLLQGNFFLHKSGYWWQKNEISFLSYKRAQSGAHKRTSSDMQQIAPLL